ncbi:MAG: diguanylate cyclase [bacterium]|nr:diguanylate cyclase [bacterium]
MFDPNRILVVESEDDLRQVLNDVLSDAGYDVLTARDGEHAIDVFRINPCAIVLTDMVMGEMSGLDVLHKIQKMSPETETIMMTCHASMESAIESLRGGAYDFLIKPFDDLTIVASTVARALDKQQLQGKNKALMTQLRGYARDLEEVNEQLKAVVSLDGLTDLYNHKFFREALEKELARSARHSREFSLVFLDIDHFKQYNDRNGHLCGDELLKQLALLIQKLSRRSEVVARYGGEEFVLILPETNKSGAFVHAERLRESVMDYPFDGRETQPLGRVTMSLGVSSYPEDGGDADTLIDRADKALYVAKRQGRNRVSLAGLEELDIGLFPEDEPVIEPHT